jgi:hypothetical protein
VPHVDFKNNSDLVKSPRGHAASITLLTEFSQSAIALANKTAKSIEVQTTQLANYKEWLNQQALPEFDGTDTVTLGQRINVLTKRFQETVARPASATIAAISRNTESLIKGEKVGWEVLTPASSLDNFNGFLREQDDYSYFRSIAKNKPNMSVLEVGAGLRAKTFEILQSLTLADG